MVLSRWISFPLSIHDILSNWFSRHHNNRNKIWSQCLLNILQKRLSGLKSIYNSLFDLYVINVTPIWHPGTASVLCHKLKSPSLLMLLQHYNEVDIRDFAIQAHSKSLREYSSTNVHDKGIYTVNRKYPPRT